MAAENKGNPGPLVPKGGWVVRPQKNLYFYKENPFGYIFKKLKD